MAPFPFLEVAMARTRFGPEVCLALVDAFERGQDVGQACFAAGISRTIFYRWLARGEDGGKEVWVAFRQRVTAAMAAGDRRKLEAALAALRPAPNQQQNDPSKRFVSLGASVAC